ncbi:hypothetical protein AB0900_31255 [Streptomyces cellulosae]
MRLTLTAGGRTVDLRTDPTEGVSLRAAENTVIRLFRSLPNAESTDDEDQTFGFSLSSDTERAPETEPVEADDDD